MKKFLSLLLAITVVSSVAVFGVGCKKSSNKDSGSKTEQGDIDDEVGIEWPEEWGK